MSTFCRVAISAAVMAAACGPAMAQDFSQFSAGASASEASGAYQRLSDSETSGIVARQVAYQSLSDFEETSAEDVAEDDTILGLTNSATDWGQLDDVDDGGVSQVSLLGLNTSPGEPLSGSCGPTGCCDSLCDSGGCDACSSCQSIPCGALCTRQCPTCCGVGTHCTRIYGEALYLRARNAEVAYATPADNPAQGNIPVQVGDIGILDPDYELGFRAGASLALDTVSSIDIGYTMFESLTHDETSQVVPFIVRSMVTHPGTLTAPDDVLSSVASLEIDFDYIDASYRHLLRCSDVFATNYVIGARYAKLEQQFDVEFVKNARETVATDIDFDGGGLRLGLESARYSCRNQLHVYANGYASFLAGRFRARYFQGDAFDQTVVDAEWEAGRVVPILDVECGVGWSSKGGRVRLNAGYMVSAWFNSVTTQDYINAIQSNNFLSLNDSITFDGLQGRFEYRF